MRRVPSILLRRPCADGDERSATRARRSGHGVGLRAVILAALFLVGFAGTSRAQSNWYVDANAPVYGNGSPALPFPTIQRALDHPGRVQGDVIRIRPGVYVEDLVIEGPGAILEPTATGHGTVVLDGGRSGRVIDVVGPRACASIG